MDKNIKSVFNHYPAAIQTRLSEFRQLILNTAATTEGVGRLQETLKWGEPAYFNPNGSGTTLRLGWKPADPTKYRLLVHCQTSLIETFRTLYPDLTYEGNRAIVFDLESEPPEQAIVHCISLALTYHQDKKQASARI